MKRISAALLIVSLTGCGSDSAKLPAPAQRSIDFAADVQPIFAKHCYSCHGEQKQKAGYRLDVREIALKPEVVKAGDSAGSPLIHHLAGINERRRMPPEPPPLSDDQIAILRAWIDQGAKWSANDTSK